MSCQSSDSEEAISPTLCPNMRGRIGEAEVQGDTNSDSDSRRKEPQSENGRNLRPKGSDYAASANDPKKPKGKDDDESEIVIPETERIPNTPSIADYIKHQITHYPYKDWCPICVKNAAKNKPHKKVTNQREAETFSLDYMYMTSKPTKENWHIPY